MDIKKIALEIYNDNISEKETYYKKKYLEFSEKYETLFRYCCNGELELDKFNMMINLITKIQKNQITQYDASAAVGRHMYDVYIDPKIKDLPPTKNSP